MGINGWGGNRRATQCDGAVSPHRPVGSLPPSFEILEIAGLAAAIPMNRTGRNVYFFAGVAATGLAGAAAAAGFAAGVPGAGRAPAASGAAGGPK